MIKTTIHALKRMEERTNIGVKNVDRYINKVYVQGKKIDDFNNKEIKRYLTNIFKRSSGDTLRVYGNEIYLFGNNVLITILNFDKRIIQKTNRRKFYENQNLL